MGKGAEKKNIKGKMGGRRRGRGEMQRVKEEMLDAVFSDQTEHNDGGEEVE